MIDVVVIGAGPGGLSSSYGLARKGYTVICIDQGSAISSSEVICMKSGGEYQKFGSLSSSPLIRNDSFSYPVDCTQSPIDYHNFCGVGGSSLLFSGQYPRLHSSDFRNQAAGSWQRKWPITLSTLAKFYCQNELYSGLAGLPGDPFNPDVCIVRPTVPFGVMGQKLIEGFNNLNWSWWPAYAALDINQRSRYSLSRPTNIDISDSKASARATYYRRCLDLGVKFLLQTSVLEVIIDPLDSMKAKGVLITSQSAGSQLIEAKAIVLAAGGIGTPRILLNSVSNSWKHGIGNNYDLVGRGLMLHPWGYVDGLYKQRLDSMLGPQGCCLISQEHYQYDPAKSIVGGFTLQAVRGPWPYEGAKIWHARKKLKITRDIYEDYKKLHDHTAHLVVMVDDDPDLSNCVALDKTSSDSYGGPGVRIKYSLSESSKRKLSSGINAARTVLKASGAAKTWCYGPVRQTGWHTLGTCCMGDEPAHSVVNKYGRVHGTANLYIADGSVFARGGSINPANTIQSLGLYIAYHLSL